MAYLLDVNTLIALSWPGHLFHRSAQQWFGRHASKGWATCPIVEAGFVRIVSNPAFSVRAVTPKEAWQALRSNLKHPAHQFWPDEIPVADVLAKFEHWIVGHKQVTDAYLLGLAMYHRGTLATTDKRLLAVLGENSRERSHVELIQ
jgi:hypothetical protein